MINNSVIQRIYEGLPGNATVIAGYINELSLGSVQYVYVIQNTPMESVFTMTTLLKPHVQLVDYIQLVELARQKEILKRR